MTNDNRTARGAVALALAATLAIPATGAYAQPALPAASQTDYRPLVVGLGAIAGVVAFNALGLGAGALPGGLAYAAGAAVPAEMSVAMSRVYATTAAVIGGWIGYYGSADTANDGWPVDKRLVATGAGAVMGVVAFNLLSAPLGTVPLAGGALALVPQSVALGSRLIATTSAAVGALGANWLYDRWTGTQSNYRYLVSLAAGALAGVAAGNYLYAGTFGVPPYYVGAGVVDTAGVMASSAAQAASRVYVIGSGVLGAWVADYLYRK